MRDDVVQFRWMVHPGGYEWATGTIESKLKQVDAADDGEPMWRSSEHGGNENLSEDSYLTFSPVKLDHRIEPKSYFPMSDCPALFREFADTPQTPDGVLTFANRWGMLGGNAAHFIHTEQAIPFWGPPSYLKQLEKPKADNLITHQRIGEAFSTWVAEISRINYLVRIWDCAQDKDYPALLRLFSENPSTELSEYMDSEYKFSLAHLPFSPIRLSQSAQADLVASAMSDIRNELNLSLRQRVSPRMEINAHLNRPQIHLVPEGLIGAVWLQFAQAIHGDHRFDQCVECSAWFNVSGGSARSDKIYCSDACRMRAYRKRKSASRSK